MGRASGAGHPITFKCAAASRIYRTDPMEQARLRAPHKVELTGRTKPTPHTGTHHARKSWTTFEYRCACGHVGWSSHRDLERMVNAAVLRGLTFRIYGRS